MSKREAEPISKEEVSRRRRQAMLEVAIKAKDSELVFEYNQVMMGDLYTVFLDHKNNIKNIDQISAMEAILGNTNDFDNIQELADPFLKAIFLKGQEFVKNIDSAEELSKAFLNTNSKPLEHVVSIVKTFVLDNFKSVRQEIAERKDEVPPAAKTEINSPSPSVNRADSPLRQQRQLCDFLGLSEEQFVKIDPEIRKVMCETAIPKLESLYNQNFPMPKNENVSSLKPVVQSGQSKT